MKIIEILSLFFSIFISLQIWNLVIYKTRYLHTRYWITKYSGFLSHEISRVFQC